MFSTIEDAIEDIKKGKIIIVVDDPSRENEGDFIMASDKVTSEDINFMAKYGRGLICTSLTEERCKELELEMMVKKNSATYETPFTVSVDLIGYGCTTGISASDRAKTIKALVDKKIKPEELGKPGHVFPLKAKKGGVLRRAGHTEASSDLAKLAGFEPSGVLVEVMNEDGTMARLPELKKIAKKFNLKIITIADLISYRIEKETLVERIRKEKIKSKYGEFILNIFKRLNDDKEYFAITTGKWNKNEKVHVRVHSSNVIEDLLSIDYNGNRLTLDESLRFLSKIKKGVILYINPELSSVTKNIDKVINRVSKFDNKDYGIGAQILRSLNITDIILISKNPKKRSSISGFGLNIVEVVSP